MDFQTSIYLIGMMGSGKSVTGKKLSQRIGIPFLDMDDRLEHKLSLSIAEIFEKKGETFFREEETKTLREVTKLGPRIIATGGGIILKHENVDLMKATGKIIYLETMLETLWARVRGKSGRPLIASEDPQKKLSEIFRLRKELYENAADLKVRTDGLSAEQVAEDILRQLN